MGLGSSNDSILADCIWLVLYPVCGYFVPFYIYFTDTVTDFYYKFYCATACIVQKFRNKKMYDNSIQFVGV